MNPAEKPPTNAEEAAEEYATTRFAAYAWPWGQARNSFLAGAEWKASQVAEAVAKLEKIRERISGMVGPMTIEDLDAAIALLKKEGTK